MNIELIALQLMAIQGVLGAMDTIYHHELTEALPQRNSARKELSIHSIRSIIYAVLFIGLSAWTWSGMWAWVLILLFSVEIVLTLWDFVVEDKTRLLPPTERVMHTILAINGGAFIALLALNIPDWIAGPSVFIWAPHGLLSIFLMICGIGVGLSGIRDGFAAYQLGKNMQQDNGFAAIHIANPQENVLVTGATGFIGQQLVESLLQNKCQVTIVSRNPKQAAWAFDGRVRVVETMTELPSDYSVDLIINLAGARILGPRWSIKRKKLLVKSRVDLTKSIVTWIASAETKPRLLLSASAIGFYGIQGEGDDSELTEKSPSQSMFMSDICQQWEASAQRATDYGVAVNCMRFGLVLGRQGALPMMMMPIKLGMGGPLGGGKQWFSWIHINDLLRAMAHLSKNNLERPGQAEFAVYNFTAPDTLRQSDFSKIAGQVMHRPSFMPTPGIIMRILLGEQSDLLLEGQRVVPEKLLKEGFLFTYPDLHNALSSLK
ncbi:Cell division inhibitor [hydrothermal vent metagenome]|uniref:Cell division inhibitor n=1 Tax=hydrothermal vent metagenome TaxID=652676 RepID=A0A3B0YIP0_9ZZZZ